MVDLKDYEDLLLADNEKVEEAVAVAQNVSWKGFRKRIRFSVPKFYEKGNLRSIWEGPRVPSQRPPSTTNHAHRFLWHSRVRSQSFWLSQSFILSLFGLYIGLNRKFLRFPQEVRPNFAHAEDRFQQRLFRDRIGWLHES